jgi:hypothetical protein
MNTNDAPTQLENNNDHPCPVRQKLKKHLYYRAASLSDVEKSFLSSLLIDEPPTLEEEELHKTRIERATKVLTDDILFTVPFKHLSIDDSDGNDNAGRKPALPPKAKRSNPQLG